MTISLELVSLSKIRGEESDYFIGISFSFLKTGDKNRLFRWIWLYPNGYDCTERLMVRLMFCFIF